MAQATSQPAPPSSHYAAQAGLAAAFAATIRGQWPNLSRVELYALLTRFSQASATIAAQDYAHRRVQAGVRSGFTVPLATPVGPEQFSKTLDWVYATVTTDPSNAERRMESAMTRLAVQSGRETTVQAVTEDRQARAWAREARADCCSFCAMLASRGAVYKNADTAGHDADAKLRTIRGEERVFVGAGEFKFHDNCHCIAVPVFGVYEKTAEARAWTRKWFDLKRDLGRTPSLLEWRRLHEGRDVRTGKSPSSEEPTDTPQ